MTLFTLWDKKASGGEGFMMWEYFIAFNTREHILQQVHQGQLNRFLDYFQTNTV